MTGDTNMASIATRTALALEAYARKQRKLCRELVEQSGGGCTDTNCAAQKACIEDCAGEPFSESEP
jgi:hypothetical protein